jgi:hypothetical protein
MHWLKKPFTTPVNLISFGLGRQISNNISGHVGRVHLILEENVLQQISQTPPFASSIRLTPCVNEVNMIKIVI